jgi:F-type H+-transporting ATPase subunit c
VELLLAQTTDAGLADLGKAIAFGVGVGLGAVIQAVARQPELRGELTGIQWLGFALVEAVVFYALLGALLAFVLV